MKILMLVLCVPLVACSMTPIPIKQYKSDVVSQKPCYETNDCPMQNPPAFLFYNNSRGR
jgi:hypothetical protein